MNVPVGLLARLIRNQIQLGAMEQVGAAHDAAAMNVRARELWNACTGPNACLLILANNLWNASELDDIRVEAPSEGAGQKDALGPGPHGLYAVCPGRHVVSTTVGGETSGMAFMLYPREAFFLRLDRKTLTWSRFEAHEEQAVLDRAGAGDLALLDYNERVAARRVRDFELKTGVEAMQDCLTNLSSAFAAILAGDEREVGYRTRLASISLVGAPVLSFEPITSFLGFNAFDLTGKGRVREARALLRAGLSVLPDDPTLLAVLGELQMSAGEKEDGAANLERALARQTGLDERLGARARGLLGR